MASQSNFHGLSILNIGAVQLIIPTIEISKKFDLQNSYKN